MVVGVLLTVESNRNVNPQYIGAASSLRSFGTFSSRTTSVGCALKIHGPNAEATQSEMSLGMRLSHSSLPPVVVGGRSIMIRANFKRHGVACGVYDGEDECGACVRPLFRMSA